MFTYVSMAIAGVVVLIWRMKAAEAWIAAAAPLGASFTFLALITGSLWGKPMWGTYWVWDARLTSELILLFLYLGVIALNNAIEDPRTAARACALLAIVGVVNIPIIHYSVNWWYTLHQGPILADPVKPTTRDALAALTRDGIRIVMLTGDNRTTALAVARRLGIDEVEAEVLPDRKSAVVEKLRRDGRVVAMVGDGVNDAAALAQADLGIALGTGADVAIEASDLTLVRGDLLAAVDAIRLSRRTLATIKGNLLWAFAYNIAAIPLAAAGLLNPAIAGGAMAFSSVFVVSNSLRLRRFTGIDASPTRLTNQGE